MATKTLKNWKQDTVQYRYLKSQIRIQGFDDQKMKKKIQQKFYFFLIKNYNLPLYRTVCLRYRKPAAFKREHPALQKMKFINFFLCLWVIFALRDPDTGIRIQGLH
jgi:hypothetical protein